MMVWLLTVILIIAIWYVEWKGIGMWKAGLNNHLAWFICIFTFNTLGILPIIYILLHREKPAGSE
jgi:hypothetical protein